MQRAMEPLRSAPQIEPHPLSIRPPRPSRLSPTQASLDPSCDSDVEVCDLRPGENAEARFLRHHTEQASLERVIGPRPQIPSSQPSLSHSYELDMRSCRRGIAQYMYEHGDPMSVAANGTVPTEQQMRDYQAGESQKIWTTRAIGQWATVTSPMIPILPVPPYFSPTPGAPDRSRDFQPKHEAHATGPHAHHVPNFLAARDLHLLTRAQIYNARDETRGLRAELGRVAHENASYRKQLGQLEVETEALFNEVRRLGKENRRLRDAAAKVVGCPDPAAHRVSLPSARGASPLAAAALKPQGVKKKKAGK